MWCTWFAHAFFHCVLSFYLDMFVKLALPPYHFAAHTFCCCCWWLHSPNRRPCFSMLYLRLHSLSFYALGADFHWVLCIVWVRVHCFACRKLVFIHCLFHSHFFKIYFKSTFSTFSMSSNKFIYINIKNKAKWSYQSLMVPHLWYLELFVFETIIIRTLLLLGRN